jgi:hypothetical protein
MQAQTVSVAATGLTPSQAAQLSAGKYNTDLMPALL